MMNNLIIRNIDCVDDIDLALRRIPAILKNFLTQRVPGKTVRIYFQEKGNVALVFSNDYQQDIIAYRWESEAEHDG